MAFENDASQFMRRQPFLPKGQLPATRLLEECFSGDLAAVQVTLATEGINLNLEAELNNGWTALQAAAHHGSLDIARLLVENGAKVDVTGGLEGKSPLHMAVEDGNTELARILLEHNASPNRLALWDTPLHIAVQNENQDILQLLLEAGAVPECFNGNGETPLIIAAGKGSASIAKQLLDGGADADSVKARFNSPLLAACQGGHLDMTALLLDCGASIDKADAEGSTPLFFAVQACNIDLAKLLLRRGASTVIRGIPILASQDLGNQTPEMLQALQIKGPIQGPRITTTTLKSNPKRISALQLIMPPSEDDLHKQSSCRGFDITMVDFYVSGGVEERLPVKASVHKVLYGDGPRALLDSARKEAGIRHEPGFTWYHIPANNLTWAEHLITRLKAENDGTKVTERRMKLQRLEQSARIQLNFVRPQESSKGATAGDLFPRSFCSSGCTLGDDATAKAVMLVLPYLHFETFESFKSMSRVLKTAKARTDRLRSGREHMTHEADFEEDHVAEEHMQKAEPAMLIQSVKSILKGQRGAMSPSSLAEYGGAKNARARSSPSIYHPSQQWEARRARTFPPTGLKNRKKAETWNARNWPSHSEAAIPAAIPEETREPQTKSEPPNSTNLHSDLILGYMAGGHVEDCGFQPRRTLDQYKYPHLGSIGKRDDDQVIYRYTKASKDGHDPKIFMVDQLWMWVLEDSTLVTCAPLQWNAILKYVNPESRPESAAADALQPSQRLFPGLQPAVVREQGPQLRRVMFTAPVDGSAHCLEEVHDAVKNSAPCSITNEIKSLIEIADILDELEILKAVLEDQGNVLNSFNDAQARRASIFLERNDATSSPTSVDGAVRESHLVRIDAMRRSAKKVEESFYRITDLKQKHASQREARETARQGQAIVLFTVVTIVFLPISFMAAFFTINIDELHVKENGKLPLAYVVKYMMAVGLGLSVPCIIIGFNWDATRNRLGVIKFLAERWGSSVFLWLVLTVCVTVIIIVWESHWATNMKSIMTVGVALVLLLSFVAYLIYRLVAMVRDGSSLTSTSASDSHSGSVQT